MTSGKTYSAGTIFLQVVPVFGDTQNAIRRQAQDWNKSIGDEMEKDGEKVGERAAKAVAKGMDKGGDEVGRSFQKKVVAAAKDAQKAIDGLNFSTASEKSLKDLERVQNALKRLGDTKIDADFSAKKALTELALLQGALETLTKGDHEIEISADLLRARKALKQIEAEAEKIAKEVHTIKFGAEFESKMAERAMGNFEKKIRDSARRAADALGDSMDKATRKIKSDLESIADAEIGIDMRDEDALRALERLQAKAREVALTSISIETRLNAAKTEAEIAALLSTVRRADGQEIDIKVDVDAGAAVGKMGLLSALFTPAAGAGDAAANSFRSFRGVILAVAAVLPALIPIIGGVGGALLGLIPVLAAVGAGFTAMLVGFSGIGNAVGALGDQANDAAKDSAAAANTMRAASYAVADAKQALADAERNAAQAAADAARAVADARRAAADAIEDALDRQRDAQEAYADSVDDVRDAEQALRDARKRAEEEQKDTADQIRQNALDIREAQLAAFDATNHFNAVMADGSSTAYDKEAAEVAMLQARERLHELRDTQAELAEDKKKQDKDGVEGSEEVKDAQEQLLEAIEAQKDAHEAVGEAAEAVDRARQDGARRVADAIRAQQRAEADGARNVARAQEQLRRAQEAYGQALYETGELGSASMQKLDEAMSKLGPAGQRFARFLHSLRDEFFAFRNAIQEGMLPGVQRAMEALIAAYGPQFTAFMAQMGMGVGMFFESLAASLQGPAWRGFFASIAELGPSMMASMGSGFLSFMEGMASVLTAVAPFAERLARGIANLMDSFARWAASSAGQEGVIRFMEYAERVGPKVLDFIGGFAKAATNVAVALAPWGDMVLTALTGVLNWIAAMDPKTLGVIAGVLIGMVVVFQLAVGAVALFLGGMAAMKIPASRFILLAGGMVVVLAAMAIRFEWVRDVLGWVGEKIKENIGFITGLLKVIGAVILAVKAWNLAMKVAILVQRVFNTVVGANPIVRVVMVLFALGAAVVWAYKKFPAFRRVVDKVIGAVIGFFRKLWKIVVEDVIPAIVGGAKWLWENLKRIFGWINTNVIQPMAAVFRWLWSNVIRPALTIIFAYWKFIFNAMKYAWTQILWPVLSKLMEIMWGVWKVIFKVALTLIWEYWKWVFRRMKEVWDNTLHPVLKAFWSAIKYLWREVIKPLLGRMKTAWDVFAGALKAAWRGLIKPMLDAFMDKLGGKKGLQKKFEQVVGAIKDLWNGLKKIIAAPIKFVMKTVLNDGLIKGFNKIAKFVGVKEIDPIHIPPGIDEAYATGGVYGKQRRMATGGVLPGYTPGSDVHHFTSPSGGRLHLSGGEAIMRPEFTAAMGEGWVNYMNSLARAEGPRGIRRRLAGDQGYFLGGVLPLPGARISRHNSGYSSAWAGDMNVGSGNDDYGMPIHAWKSGMVALMRYLGDRSYGRYMDINHGNQSSRYAHMSAFASGLREGMLVAAGQTVGYVGDIGNTSAAHLHFEVNGGSVPVGNGGDGGGGGPSFPGWLVKIAKNPFKYVKNLVAGPIDTLKEKFGNSTMLQYIASVPGKLVNGVKDKIWDILPGPLKSFVGGVGDVVSGVAEGVGNVVDGAGDVLGFRDGGVLPYNGTMMYDSGGYLPPGITNVVNLTGKPEPVFTPDQFAQMGGPGGNGGMTYAPTFNGTDLTADDIIDDFEFTYRKMSRGGKYEGSSR